MLVPLRSAAEPDRPPDAAAPAPRNGAITALGRIQPKDGVIAIAGPSEPSPVVSKLLVDDNDRVEAGQVIAILDTLAAREAMVRRLDAELKHWQTEYDRRKKLYRDGILSVSERDDWRTQGDILRAELERAKAERDHAVVRAPITGRVLKVHARSGERVGPRGIVELGKTDEMYAIAEVYETDIGRVRFGQRAVITSPALAREVRGTVDRIGLKIGKQDVLATDPAAKTDARVVEVEILLDDPEQVAGFTHLQVDVAITP